MNVYLSYNVIYEDINHRTNLLSRKIIDVRRK